MITDSITRSIWRGLGRFMMWFGFVTLIIIGISPTRGLALAVMWGSLNISTDLYAFRASIKDE